jgi:hypothetical protein
MARFPGSSLVSPRDLALSIGLFSKAIGKSLPIATTERHYAQRMLYPGLYGYYSYTSDPEVVVGDCSLNGFAVRADGSWTRLLSGFRPHAAVLQFPVVGQTQAGQHS